MVPDDELLPVLHGLRLVGFAATDVVADRARVGSALAETLLRRAESQGLATYRSGRATGWTLTAVGRAHGEALLAAQLDREDRRGHVYTRYERFLELNPRFLELCTDWQLRPAPSGELVVNDHRDEAYDLAMLERLGIVDDEVQLLLDGLAEALERFGRYGTRLAEARRLLASGDLDWFTRPVIDSYHTVWFELHEDLLATLGLERSTESGR